MRNPPSCQLQTSEGDGEEGKEGTGEEGVWIRRFTPTDLHLPRRLSRPPPAAARTALPAGAAAAPRHQLGLHRRPRLSQERARKQDAASGYVRASPTHPAHSGRRPPETEDRNETAAAGPAESPLKPTQSVLNHLPRSQRFLPDREREHFSTFSSLDTSRLSQRGSDLASRLYFPTEKDEQKMKACGCLYPTH